VWLLTGNLAGGDSRALTAGYTGRGAHLRLAAAGPVLSGWVF